MTGHYVSIPAGQLYKHHGDLRSLGGVGALKQPPPPPGYGFTDHRAPTVLWVSEVEQGEGKKKTLV